MLARIQAGFIEPMRCSPINVPGDLVETEQAIRRFSGEDPRIHTIERQVVGVAS
jgi:hypothetical protein